MIVIFLRSFIIALLQPFQVRAFQERFARPTPFGAMPHLLQYFPISLFVYRASVHDNEDGEAGEEAPGNSTESWAMWAIRHVATAKGVQMTWSPWASTTASLVWGAALSLPRAGYPPRYLHVLIRNPLLTRMMNSVEAVMDVAALAAEGFNEKERWMINEAAIKGPEHDEILISRCDYQDLIVLIVPGDSIPPELANRLYPLLSRHTAAFVTTAQMQTLEQDVHTWLLSQV